MIPQAEKRPTFVSWMLMTFLGAEKDRQIFTLGSLQDVSLLRVKEMHNITDRLRRTLCWYFQSYLSGEIQPSMIQYLITPNWFRSLWIPLEALPRPNMLPASHEWELLSTDGQTTVSLEVLIHLSGSCWKLEKRAIHFQYSRFLKYSHVPTYYISASFTQSVSSLSAVSISVSTIGHRPLCQFSGQ